jgi:phosphopantothenate-cysteine ligase
MKIIVTTGGTIEAIDGVRGITNFSSGRLGIMIAEQLANKHQVFLVRGKKTPRPEHTLIKHQNDEPGIVDMEVMDAASVMHALDSLHTLHSDMDVVVQAMAISDYMVSAVFDAQSMVDVILDLNQAGLTRENLLALFQHPPSLNGSGKISSTLEHPLIALKQTPKIIGKIKSFWPRATLFGFKLLNDVSEEELLSVAAAAMEKNHADYMVANDLRQISKTQHQATVMARDGRQYRADTKEEIADIISRLINQDSKVHVYLNGSQT